MMHSFGLGWLFSFFLILWSFELLWSQVFHAGKTREKQRRYSTRPAGNITEASLYRLAQKHNGSLTVSDVVVETDIPARKAEKLLQSITDGIRIRMEVKEDGTVIYEFPELIRLRPSANAAHTSSYI